MSTQPWHPSWVKRSPRNHNRQDLVDLWTKYSEEASANINS